jgi:hypothetical protein
VDRAAAVAALREQLAAAQRGNLDPLLAAHLMRELARYEATPASPPLETR